MKIPGILFLVIVLWFNSLDSSAQNWNLIQLNERHHFYKAGEDIPKHTMLIDSFQVEGHDTTFYLNRFFLPCDTCSEEGFYLDNQPGFLQREIHKKANGMQVLMNPETFFIQVTGTVDDIWWFNAEKTQQANVTALETKQIFGEADSVMTIAIDGTDQIELSKNHGVLQFFDYTLGGLENAQKGEWIPGFNEIYDFQVGDVFQYTNDYWGPDQDECGFKYYHKKTIRKVERNGDTLKLTVENKKRHQLYPFCDDLEEYTSEEIVVNTKSHLSNSYHNQKIKIWSYEWADTAKEIGFYGETTPYCTYVNVEEMYTTANAGMKITFPLIAKSIGYLIQDDQFAFKGVQPGIFKMGDWREDIAYDWKKVFVNKLGKSYDKFSQFETESMTELIGYVKNGDTTGVVYSDSYMMDVPEDKLNDLKPEIYPNPSNGYFSVDFEKPEFEVSIYAVNGKLMDSFKASSHKVYHLNNLENGLYLVKIEYDNTAHYLKWVKE